MIGSASGDRLPTIGWRSADGRPTSYVNEQGSLSADGRAIIGRQSPDWRPMTFFRPIVARLHWLSAVDRPMIARPMALISHAPYFYSVHVHCIHRIWAMAFAGMPTWMDLSRHFILWMFSSFWVKKATDVQIINSAILYSMCMRTDVKMSYDWSTDSCPQVGRSSADSLHVARQGSTVGRRSADYRPTVGRMENFVVGEGNQWGIVLMWQLKSADQNVFVGRST